MCARRPCCTAVSRAHGPRQPSGVLEEAASATPRPPPLPAHPSQPPTWSMSSMVPVALTATNTSPSGLHCSAAMPPSTAPTSSTCCCAAPTCSSSSSPVDRLVQMPSSSRQKQKPVTRLSGPPATLHRGSRHATCAHAGTRAWVCARVHVRTCTHARACMPPLLQQDAAAGCCFPMAGRTCIVSSESATTSHWDVATYSCLGSVHPRQQCVGRSPGARGSHAPSSCSSTRFFMAALRSARACGMCS